jgi:hypothetical protein
MPVYNATSDVSINDAISAYDRSASHPNPAFDFLTGFVPRKLKDLFRWTEYLVYNSAHIYAAQKKFGELVVTDIEYNTSNDALRKKYKRLYDKTLKIKAAIMMALLDKGVYGNHFTSMYQPFVRYLKCPDCEHMINIEHVDYKFTLKKMQFLYACPRCRRTVAGKLIDRKIIAPERIHIIRWDPKRMDIEFSPITGQSRYFYNIPEDVKDKVKLGSKHLINTMPKEFLEAIKDDHVFEFERDAIFHMKVPAPSGMDQQWGFPSLATTIKLFLYTMVLRKANEAIALEHIVPFRIVHPAQSNGMNPMEMIQLDNWREEMKGNIKRWRRDPLHMMFAPIPVGTTNIGGDGRAMLTLGEVQEADKSIMAALGIPQEFLYGGLTKAGMEGTLRLIENQLQNDADMANQLLQWYTDKLSRYLGWERLDVELAPLKMVDDTEIKNILMGLATGSNGGSTPVSLTTAMEKIGINLSDERDKRLQEQLDEMRFNQKVQTEVQKLQNTLAQQVAAQVAGAAGLNYDQQAVIGRAEELAQQLMGFDPGTRRSQLHDLQVTDYVMYSVVIQRLEEMQNAQMHDAMAQQQGGGAQPMQ